MTGVVGIFGFDPQSLNGFEKKLLKLIVVQTCLTNLLRSTTQIFRKKNAVFNICIYLYHTCEHVWYK